MSAAFPAPPADALPYPRRAAGIARRAHARFVLVVGAGTALALVWAAVTHLDTVTRGQGRVVPQSNNKVVQHLEGGIVTEILAREGEQVAAGAPLMRIDNSFSRAELVQAELELKARRLQLARLEAEIAGATTLELPLFVSASLPELAAREQDLFRARGRGLQAQIAVVEEQATQKRLELAELTTRWRNTQAERDLLAPRVQSVRRLVQMGAASRNELIDNERGLQQIDARLAELTHEIPRAESALTELARRRDEITLRFRSDAEKDRRETGVQIARFEETIRAMEDRSRRSEVVAPVAGIVNKLFVTTVGGVVKSGEPLAQIVPADASVIVEARLSPRDRAEVWPGLKAVVKISAYDYALHGALQGKVLDISPDAFADEKGEPYFRVRLEAGQAALGPGKPIVPGMQAQVDILTGRHSVLDYLLKPIRLVRDNALRQ
jgi:HlyD family type I secretion membrane fusion protein